MDGDFTPLKMQQQGESFTLLDCWVFLSVKNVDHLDTKLLISHGIARVGPLELDMDFSPGKENKIGKILPKCRIFCLPSS